MAAVTSQNFLNFWNVKINKLEYMSCLPWLKFHREFKLLCISLKHFSKSGDFINLWFYLKTNPYFKSVHRIARYAYMQYFDFLKFMLNKKKTVVRVQSWMSSALVLHSKKNLNVGIDIYLGLQCLSEFLVLLPPLEN
jgi:hypothetical protein